jgi:hypothetical protein
MQNLHQIAVHPHPFPQKAVPTTQNINNHYEHYTQPEQLKKERYQHTTEKPLSTRKINNTINY